MILQCRCYKPSAQIFRAGVWKIPVGVYLPTARGYMDIDDKSLKCAVREVSGGWNTSSLFLPATSKETSVTSQTGKMRKSVVKIPRSKVAPQLIRKLDDCK